MGVRTSWLITARNSLLARIGRLGLLGQLAAADAALWASCSLVLYRNSSSTSTIMLTAINNCSTAATKKPVL